MHPKLTDDFRRLPLAHRALHDSRRGVIENSRTAMIAALEAGYGIELDVQLSQDGQAMVFHDETLNRLTGEAGWVCERPASALMQIALSGSADTIPSLPQILDLVGGRVPLLIEVKDQTGQMGESDGRLEAAVAKALSTYQGPVALMSFNPHAVARLRDLCPSLPRGLTTGSYTGPSWAPLSPAVCDHLRAIPDYDRVGASFISHEWTDLSRPRVRDLAAWGADLLCWTVKSAADEAEARRAGADNITFEAYAAAFPA